jgi:hypothetical protein
VVALAVLPQVPYVVCPIWRVSCVDHNSSRIRAIAHNSNRSNFSNNSHSSSNNSSVMLLLHHHSRMPPVLHSNSPQASFHASTIGSGPLCSRMPPAQAKQLTMSFVTRGQSAEGPSEGSYTTDGLRQLHHRGGDSHERRSVSGYVLPPPTSYCYSI